MTFTPTCMTADELAAWRAMAVRVRNGGERPCVDCPAAFAAAMRASGCCNGRPFRTGRPRLSRDVQLQGRGRKYATEEERIAARRQSWRNASKRRRVVAWP